MARKQKNYRRGGSDHYAAMARKSVDSRIKRHIEVEVVRDPSRVTAYPVRRRESDAGYDITTPENVSLKPGAEVVVMTGIRACCPRGYFYEVRGRSSLNAAGIEVVGNIIDATYTGEIRVRLHNRSKETVKFAVGDRIAQLIFLPQIHVKFRPVKQFAPDADARGDAGFGSSGRQ